MKACPSYSIDVTFTDIIGMGTRYVAIGLSPCTYITLFPFPQEVQQDAGEWCYEYTSALCGMNFCTIAELT